LTPLIKSRSANPPPLRELPAFTQAPWQMSYGERTVIEGMLAMVSPRLSIEIGRAEGGSLRRIAAHSEAVISFDIVEPSREVTELDNVTPFTGDSHRLLPIELERIASDGGNVDFVLVDGDHSAEGVREDMLHLLASDAITRTVILSHDTLNQDVRSGLSSIDYDSYGKVAWVDLDFVPGYVAQLPERLGECWGGLGLTVVDASGDFQSAAARHSEHLVDQSTLIWPAADWIRKESDASIELVPSTTLSRAENEAVRLREELERERHWLGQIQQSASWRLTEPLRALKRLLRG
jgi:hypothetical protein